MELLTTTQVAEFFGVTDKTVRNWVYLNAIPVIRTPGGFMRFRRDVMEKIAAGDPTGGLTKGFDNGGTNEGDISQLDSIATSD